MNHERLAHTSEDDWPLPPQIPQARLPGERATACWRVIVGLGRLQGAVRTHAVDGLRQMLRQHREQLIDRQAGLARHLLQLLVAERGAQLVGRDRQVGAIAEPGGHLAAEATLLQLLPAMNGRHAGDNAVREAFAGALMAQLSAFYAGRKEPPEDVL